MRQHRGTTSGSLSVDLLMELFNDSGLESWIAARLCPDTADVQCPFLRPAYPVIWNNADIRYDTIRYDGKYLTRAKKTDGWPAQYSDRKQKVKKKQKNESHCLSTWRPLPKEETVLFYLIHRTTLWVRKNWATFIFTVTLANVGRFFKFL